MRSTRVRRRAWAPRFQPPEWRLLDLFLGEGGSRVAWATARVRNERDAARLVVLVSPVAEEARP